MIAKLTVPFVDVRDVALGHLKAMTVPKAAGISNYHWLAMLCFEFFPAGKRHLIVNRVAWIKDVAEIVDKEFRPQGSLNEKPLVVHFKTYSTVQVIQFH